MRKVTVLPILVFFALLSFPLLLTGGCAFLLMKWLDGRFWGEILLALLVVFVFLVLTVVVYRAYISLFPFPEGELAVGSAEEFRYLVYIMFWLMVFLPVLRLCIIPVPLSRLVLIALGGKVGEGTYSSGLVFDPHLVSIGAGTQLGIDCLIIPHAQAAGKLAHHRVCIGDNVTIGGRSVIMAGAVIEDGAVVGFCSLVTKGTHIRKDEVWGGVPARLIRAASTTSGPPADA